jgi:hypothetical protein
MKRRTNSSHPLRRWSLTPDPHCFPPLYRENSPIGHFLRKNEAATLWTKPAKLTIPYIKKINKKCLIEVFGIFYSKRNTIVSLFIPLGPEDCLNRQQLMADDFEKGGIMICSPCKNCHRKDLPKDKCVGNCQLLKSIQEMDSSSGNVNEGCGIDYTEEYGYHISPVFTSNDYGEFHHHGC